MHLCVAQIEPYGLFSPEAETTFHLGNLTFFNQDCAKIETNQISRFQHAPRIQI